MGESCFINRGGFFIIADTKTSSVILNNGVVILRSDLCPLSSIFFYFSKNFFHS